MMLHRGANYGDEEESDWAHIPVISSDLPQ
jgi:hypothetical protein